MSDEEKQRSAEDASKRRVGCLRRVLGVLLGVVVIFALGAGSVYGLRLLPVARENRSLQTELTAANAELADLRPLVAENKSLAEELQRADARLRVLSALVDVNAARVSLAQGDRQTAVTQLETIDAGLTDLGSRLTGEQAAAVGQMRDRLSLVRGEIESDSFAAQRDLEVLANDLSQLARELGQG